MTTRLEIVQGDIVAQEVDAVVNAANRSLLGGGGVDGAIHRAGGPAILEACRELRATRYPDGLPTGESVATTAGDLPARWVIHTVGPVYAGAEDDPRRLASCHVTALRVADELGAASIAFPAISTGAYSYPIREAARVALTTVRTVPTRTELVRFVLFDRSALSVFAETADLLEGVAPYRPDDLTTDGPTSAWTDVVVEAVGRFADMYPGL